MASKVYDSEVVELDDGTKVTLKPLNIAALRRFMDAWESAGELEDNDEGYDIFVKCSGIALNKQLNEKIDNRLTEDGELTPEYKDYLEDVLDMPTIYRIMDVCGGLKMDDPKLLEAAVEAIKNRDGEN